MATSTRPSYDTDLDPAEPTVRNERSSMPPADLGQRSAAVKGAYTGWVILAALALVVVAALIVYNNSTRVTAPTVSNDTNATQSAPALPDATGSSPAGGTGTQPSGNSETSPPMSPPSAAPPSSPPDATPAPSGTKQP